MGLVAADCSSSRNRPGSRKAESCPSAIDLTSILIEAEQSFPGKHMSRDSILGKNYVKMIASVYALNLT